MTENSVPEPNSEIKESSLPDSQEETNVLPIEKVSRETRISFLMDQYQAQQEMVIFADTKVAGLLLLNGAILLFLLSKISILRQVFEKYPASFYPYLLLILVLGMISLIWISCYFGFSALIPRYTRFENKIKAPLMIFFTNINQHYPTPESYSHRLKQITADEIERDLSHQIVEVSYILSVKYRHIRLAALFIASSFPLLAIFYSLLFEF